MRIRIIIDTQDADDPDAVTTGTPFTLNAYYDDDDGTPSRQSLEIGSESCLAGGDIAQMLHDLAGYWGASAIRDQNDEPLPGTATQWRTTGQVPEEGMLS